MTAPTIDFDDLVRECRFDELVRDHRARLVRLIYKQFGNWADAEEAVQEALVRLWADRTRIDEVQDLAGWVFASARFKVLEIAASRRRATPALLGEHIERVEASQCEPSSLPCIADPEVMDRVRVALAAMTPTQRAVVELHCLQGKPNAEVAEMLGISRQSVSQQLHMALHHVDLAGPAWRDVNTERGVESPEAKAFRASPHLLKMLPPRTREAVRLRYVERLPAAEAAARMGVSRHALRLHIKKARVAARSVMAALQNA
ncbi:MAG TPA: sigma-70 family RNA polymerase sigma factor [Micromonospora sp.]